MILVTGATGSVGQHLVSQLTGQGREVRAVSRKPVTLPGGTVTVAADLAEPASLAGPVCGAGAVFLLWPFLSPDQTRRLAPQVLEVLTSRPRRIVYVSAEAAGSEPTSSWALVERSIQATGADWTFLRASGFAKNTLVWAPQIAAGDVVRWPYGQAARSLIDEADIAAAAAAALTGEGHARQTYLITGPAAVTQADQVRILGEVLHRPLRWAEMPPGEAQERLAAMFGSREFAAHALATWAGFVDRPETVTRTVQEITGRPARSFRDWAAGHTADFTG